MLRDYMIASPSLDGILTHDSMVYDGIRRPEEIIRAFDKPHNERLEEFDEGESRKILHSYFNDLYGLFMRKMGQIISDSELSIDDEVKLQAILQELIKVKKLLTKEVVL